MGGIRIRLQHLISQENEENDKDGPIGFFMTRLVLIRHGVTKWNKEGRYCGRKDIGLSDEGRDQVRFLFKKLNTAGFGKIYCSDRKRAAETARILFKGEKIIPRRGLREINFGVLEGLRHEEIMKKYGNVYEKWLKDCFKNRIPGAEPMDVFKKRVESAFTGIIRSNPGKTIAIVCHGGVIGMFVKGILRNKDFWSCIPSPASVTIIEHEKGRHKLKKFNDTAYLKGER